MALLKELRTPSPRLKRLVGPLEPALDDAARVVAGTVSFEVDCATALDRVLVIVSLVPLSFRFPEASDRVILGFDRNFLGGSIVISKAQLACGAAAADLVDVAVGGSFGFMVIVSRRKLDSERVLRPRYVKSVLRLSEFSVFHFLYVPFGPSSMSPLRFPWVSLTTVSGMWFSLSTFSSIG